MRVKSKMSVLQWWTATIDSWNVHDHHEMCLISALTAVNLISCSLAVHVLPLWCVCPRAILRGGWNYLEKLFQINKCGAVLNTEKASSAVMPVFLRRFVRWYTSDAEPYLPRPLARTPRARRWPSGACEAWRAKRTTLTSDTSVSRCVGSCPSAYKWGIERDINHPTRRRTYRCHQTQQRCLTPCLRCASWDSSPSPPPVTSRTAPEEGSERCRRLDSDRWGPLSALPLCHSFGKLGLEISLSAFKPAAIICKVTMWKKKN